MSFATQHFIYCDGDRDDCPLDGGQGFPDSAQETKAELWDRAQRHGWTRKGNKHFCKTCSEQREQKP